MSEEIQEIQEKIITDKALSSILTKSYEIINKKLNTKKISVCIDKENKHWWVGYNTEIIATDSETPTINEEDNTWVVGVTTTDIKDDNFEYCIENINGYWFIGNDTGIVAEGKSLKKLEKDENDDFIATYTDNTTENIGHLDVDISADFLTFDGFGKIRFYQGEFQYFNNGIWIDIELDAINNLLTLTPQCMKNFYAEYDSELGNNILTIKEPSDTVVDGQTVCFVEKVIIVRKKDSIPQSTTDGDEVMTIHRRDFGKYKNTPYVDTECNAQEGDVWYYRAFPVSTMGIMNELEESNVTDTAHIVYGFRIDQNESDPDSMITYIEKNKNYSPAYMDFSTDTFNYGDWEDIWFIKNLKPCMLKYDGTVDYELDKNDYTQKVNGSGESDVSNSSYEGNAMVGIPKVYWKIKNVDDGITNVYFSKTRPDSDYHCWSHMDCNGNEIDYCYLGIYPMSVKNGIGRSISSSSSESVTYQNAKTYTNAVNLTDDVIWSIPCYSDFNLLFLLFMLLTKNTDFASKIGHGLAYRGSGSNGKLNKNGLFYGKSTDCNFNKFLGIENLTGVKNCYVDGFLYKDGNFLYKYTYSNKDGSDTNSYNDTGDGYLSIVSPITSSVTNLKKLKFEDSYIIPVSGGGSNTTYWGNSVFYLNGGNHLGFGGNYVCGSGKLNLFYWNTSSSITSNYTDMGTRLACRPLAPNN